uniref:Uncharacterized protein n=1 Tax=Octopus bimaculoides TaxID=37653 RepID=A0A0L8G2P8_OCTBM
MMIQGDKMDWVFDKQVLIKSKSNKRQSHLPLYTDMSAVKNTLVLVFLNSEILVQTSHLYLLTSGETHLLYCNL